MAAAAAVGGASASVVQNTGEEPLYVNAKQYHRILKRREARTKWEAYNKNPKKVKVSIWANKIWKIIFLECIIY